MPDPETRVIPRRPQQDGVPLSFAQERMWFLDRLEPGNPAYNCPLALHLTGLLDGPAVERALGEILRRHEALRATFHAVEGRPVQTITPPHPLTLPVVDLSGNHPAERETQARRLAAQEAQRPFDLGQGPLVRATLLRLGSEEHVLLLAIQHIAFDGWSAGVLVEELAALYEAFSTGHPSPLAELPIQNADFAHWQRERLQSGVLEKEFDYWKENLVGAPPLSLPTDRPRPAVQTYRGACESQTLSPALLKSLKALSQQEGVTLFMTLLAAFQTLLHRYAGQDDIVVGSLIAGRTPVETEGLIGCFINPLVLRTDLSGDPTFRELLGRVRAVALGAYAHQDLPFEKLVETLQPERDPSRTPLFGVVFNLENIPEKTVEKRGLTVGGFELDIEIAPFDLSLDVAVKAEGLSCVFTYNTDLFDAATTKRMLGHLQVLLEAVVSDPGQRIGMLPLLTEGERHQMLVEWNDTRVGYPQDLCVHQLFEIQAKRTPDAVAAVFEDQRLTYRELNTRANQLARYLRKRGVVPEELVGICVERSLEMVIGLLGILKAGGAYVPLDPSYPRDRLAFMLEDAGVSALLTQERLVAALPRHVPRMTCLDTEWEAMIRESGEAPANEVTGENLACVIYTSGSTGRPKGVGILHSAVVNLLLSRHWKEAPTPGDVLAAVATLCFDISALELFLPLAGGACLLVVSRQVASDGTQLLRQLIDSGSTIMIATPVTWRLLLQTGWREPSQLRILCGGEVLNPELANQLLERGIGLWNLYGPTETTIFSTVHKVKAKQRPIPIGRPIENTQIYVLDARLEPMPTGMAGELYIGGHGLARGYLARPGLTAERFIPNPFTEEPGTRLYKTGDLARYLPDGSIEFLGRLDHQVKLRGYRIELAEIETVLEQHPAVQNTVVLAREDGTDDKRVVAYIVLEPGPEPTVTAVRRFLEERLPPYMVPSTFVFLDVLPLTPNGKVDRRALPAPDWARPELEEVFVAPRTPVEEVLAGIWADLLRLEQVGVHDNFFELGGHSLLATQVISRIVNTFRVEVPVQSIFEAPTVAGLAVVITQSQAKNVDREDLDRILAEVEEFSQGEARRLVADEREGIAPL